MTAYPPDYVPRLADHGGDMSKRWFIDFRIWDTDKQAFVRKQYTGMNKYTTLADRRRVSKKKLAEIKAMIAEGYTAGTTPVVNIGIDPARCTVVEAAQFVLKQKAGLAVRTGEFYSSLITRIKEYKPFAAARFAAVQPVDVLSFMQHLRKTRGVKGKNYNNYLNSLSTFYNYFVKLDLLTKNPCKALERDIVETATTHRPYTEQQRQKIREAIVARGDKQLQLYISFVYYCFIRSGGELQLLRVRDIQERTVLIPSSRAKNNKAEHVTIPATLQRLIQEHDLRSYPPDYFVFTREGKPGLKAVGKNFFYRRHSQILQDIGLVDDGYTIYGYKHTGAINLYLATKDIEVVRRHCRHSNASQTADYLREVGILQNEDQVDLMPDF